MTVNSIKLYTKDLPPEQIPILVAPFDTDDSEPEDEEITNTVWKLKKREVSWAFQT